MFFFSSIKGELPELLKSTTNGTGNGYLYILFDLPCKMALAVAEVV